MSTNGPSFMRDIYNLTITPTGGSAITVYGVTKVSTNQSLEVLLGKDNNVIDPVASHVTGRDTKLTFSFDDFAAYASLLAGSPYVSASFTYLPPGQSIVTTPDAAQTVTVSSAVMTGLNDDQGSKQFGTYQASYTALGLTSGANPLAVSAASGAPTGNSDV